jgi:capsular exopolysaccharide synthesis family protein
MKSKTNKVSSKEVLTKELNNRLEQHRSGELSERISNKGVLTKELRTMLEQQSSGELSSVESNILSAAGDKSIKTIFVTSCYPNEGKSIGALSTAYALANKSNSKVLLVDGNFNSPIVHDSFNLELSPGLSDYLVSGTAGNEILRETDIENLNVVTSGTEMSNMLENFKSETFQEKLLMLCAGFDYVVFDGYSVFGSVDASIVARYFDGIILVLECEKTRWEVVQQAKERLANVGGKIIGVTLNRRKYYIPSKFYARS